MKTAMKSRIMMTVVVAAATLAHATPASAQAALLGPGAAYLGGGIARVSTGELDDRLESSGYPTFGQNATSIGIGAYRILSNCLMLGFEATPFFVGEETRAGGGDVTLGGGYATLGVGYAVPLTRRIRVYPRVGIGAGGMSLEIDSGTDTIDFDDVLEEPTPAPIESDPILSRDGIVFDVGGGAEFVAGGRSGMLLGLRVGYVVAPWDDNWDLVYQGSASGGPDASIAGPYARITLGWAWGR